MSVLLLCDPRLEAQSVRLSGTTTLDSSSSGKRTTTQDSSGSWRKTTIQDSGSSWRKTATPESSSSGRQQLSGLANMGGIREPPRQGAISSDLYHTPKMGGILIS